MLNKAIGSLLCAAGFLAGGAAWADQIYTPPQNGKDPSVVIEMPDPTLTPREISEREQEYFAALKRCEPLAGDLRQECIKSVQSKHGVM
jgi:hypothetical protein